MGDMRASDYALWPWPLMLDKGERVKLKLKVDGGLLVVWGVLAESPDQPWPEVWSGTDIRFKIDTSQAHTVKYTVDGSFPVTLVDTYGVDQTAVNPSTGEAVENWNGSGILPPISLTGVFVAVGGVKGGNEFGLHLDDVRANQEKADRLSHFVVYPDTDGDEEPGT